MGAENLEVIFNALSQHMQPDLHRQWNRTTVLLGKLSAVGGISEGEGKNVAFDVEFSGATAGTVAEGSDVAAGEFASDIDIPAIFPWCTYRSSFQVSEQMIDAARRSNGTPEALMNIFGSRMLSCGAKIAEAIEQDALTGTGVDASGNPALIGVFGGALTASGLYGGISAGVYTEWASSVLSNGGTPRTLTLDLLEQADDNVFTKSSVPWDAIMTTSAVTRKYSTLFQSVTAPFVRFNDNAASPSYGVGVPNNDQMQPDGLYWKGRPLTRNRLAPSGQLALLNTSKLQIKYLPHEPNRAEREFIEKIGLQGSSGGMAPIQATNLPMRVASLAKTGDSTKVTMRVTLAMAAVRRNAMAIVKDLLET